MDKTDFTGIFEESLNDIIGLLAIASVYDETTSSTAMPYGSEVGKAFMYMREKAQKDGFRTEEYDGHALSVSFGKGNERIDIACHLDVVAADAEDFDIRIKDGRIYGRGTSDMKIPAYLVYLSMKLLKEKYPDADKEIRLVLGGDEERTMNDMRHYLSSAGMPDFAFTPDGYFPLGIGEKGAIMWTIDEAYDGIIETLEGGTQCNIISPYARAVLKDTGHLEAIRSYIEDNETDAETYLEDGRTVIEVKGIAAHASRPQLGHNATIDLLKIIADVYEDRLCKDLYDTYGDPYGRGIGSFHGEDPTECLSVNLGTLHINKGTLKAQIDCRYPYEEKAVDLTGRINNKSILPVKLDYNDDPTMCDINDPYVKVMLDTYRSITGDASKPLVSGGVSYAKVFGHCVSFGPNEEGKPQMAHQKGEYMEIDDCIRCFGIYYHTIENLLLMKEE